jgi:CubicO group peptidase (beta-lactamase class C family)
MLPVDQRPITAQRMTFCFVCFVCFVLMLTVTTTAFAQAEQVDTLFAKWSRKDSPGCAVGVIRDGQLIYQRGYGMASLDHDVPLTSRTVFYIASTSKQFTAMSIALLATRGKISLTDDIRRYLPELPRWDHPVTIAHLVYHTSGIPDFFVLMPLAGRRLEDTITDEDIISLLARQPRLNFRPGDQFQYSNSGYFLLGVIIARVTGKSLRQFAEDSLFAPLGMRDTHFHDDRTMVVPRRATGYVPKGDGFAIFATLFDRVGDGGVMTTIEDLVRWDRNFYDARVGGRAMLDLALTPGSLNDGTKLDYGFGLFIREQRGLREVSHGGIYNGFRAELVRYPEQRLSVACLCNLYSIDPGKLARSVADLYLGEDPKPASAAGESVPATAPSGTERLVGTYLASQSGLTINITLQEGRLIAALPGGGVLPQTLTPIDATRFRGVNSLKSEFTFSPSTGSGVPELRVRLTSAIGEPELLLTRAKPVSADNMRLDPYAGSYRSEALDVTYDLVVRDGRLVVQSRQAPPRLLFATVEDLFSGSGLNYRFVRDVQQRISGFELNDLTGRVRGIVFTRQ